MCFGTVFSFLCVACLFVSFFQMYSSLLMQRKRMTPIWPKKHFCCWFCFSSFLFVSLLVCFYSTFQFWCNARGWHHYDGINFFCTPEQKSHWGISRLCFHCGKCLPLRQPWWPDGTRVTLACCWDVLQPSNKLTNSSHVCSGQSDPLSLSCPGVKSKALNCS